MVLLIQCAVCCLLFTLLILPAQYRDPIKMIMSCPPEVIRRVETLPQYKDTIRQQEKSHISKKLGGLAAFVLIFAVVARLSGCRSFASAFFHVFTLFAAVNLYDLIVLDWGIFCHSRKLRIPGTEDMDKAYRDYGFHARGALFGLALGLVVALLSGGFVCLISAL